VNEEHSGEAVICGRCAAICDFADNFCRSCGLALQDTTLPSVRESRLPAVWRPPVPVVVVKSAAFIAAGTLAEMFVRRLVRNAFASRREASNAQPPAVMNGRAREEAHLESETYLLRRVRVRR
jgi:hypothetical protein